MYVQCMRVVIKIIDRCASDLLIQTKNKENKMKIEKNIF